MLLFYMTARRGTLDSTTNAAFAMTLEGQGLQENAWSKSIIRRRGAVSVLAARRRPVLVGWTRR